MNLSPIILFVYSRPWHTRQTVESLLSNEIAGRSELIIYSDGPKHEQNIEKVNEVRRYVHGIDGFKNIKIIEQSKNIGLANSIISGVTEIINQYQRVIVVEDDMVCSKNFLKFMNDALEFYKNNQNVFSISGYTYPISIPRDYDHNVFLAYRGSPWGWASWLDRWNKVDWKIKDFVNFINDRNLQRQFNRGGDDLTDMLIAAVRGKIDAWAIKRTYSQFKAGSYTLYPTVSKIKNIGYDGSGAHCPVLSKWDVDLDPGEKNITFESKLEVDERINESIRQLFKYSLPTKLKMFFMRLAGLR